MQTFFLALLGIIWIDLLLSGDNAVVIALVARQLPASKQKWGIIGGTVAAIGLRVVMASIAGTLLGVPALSIAGGAFLVYVAAKMVMGEEDEAGPSKVCTTLTSAITTIALADAGMSLDNVMAIAGLAHGSYALMWVGVLLSIPLVIAGAALISAVVARFPVLVWAGAALLGYVAGGLVAGDPWAQAVYNGPEFVVGIAGVAIVLAAGGYSRIRAI
ncbi:TerC family protein [Bradyrhizobium lupini]|uniref:TerC family protein n=1 Tax=Rhizobium lupini TaxID=136996 RepID=UPI0034C5F4AA